MILRWMPYRRWRMLACQDAWSARDLLHVQCFNNCADRLSVQPVTEWIRGTFVTLLSGLVDLYPLSPKQDGSPLTPAAVGAQRQR